MKELIKLFWVFFRIGGLTFGGGYAMLPLLEAEVVDRYHWTTREQLLDYYAIGQCTPGIIAVNTATFVGYKQHGILGACFATLGVIFPSVVIITCIAAFLKNFSHITWVQHAFAGIRVAVVALIINTIVKMWRTGIKDAMGIALFIIVFVLSASLSLSPIWYVAAAALVGIAVKRGGKRT